MDCYQVTLVTRGSVVTNTTTVTGVTAVTSKGYVMTKPMPSAEFRSAMRDRRANHPLDRISAYKLRESRDNLQHGRDVVASITDYQRARPCDRHSVSLVGCTPEDTASLLKRFPGIIARELGYNLIPAVAALTVEGVPAGDINTFIQSIKPQVDQLLVDCDAIQTGNARSIKPEYAAMTAGNSELMRLSKEALHIAEQAVVFCEQHRVL